MSTTKSDPVAALPVVGLWQCIEGLLHDFNALGFLEGQKPRLTVGVDSDCSIKLDDVLVSGVHFELRRQHGEVHIRDLASTNGTFLNGEPLRGGESRQIVPYSRVVVGTTAFVAVDRTLRVPVLASTHSSFLRGAATTHGSDSAAARAIGKSRDTIRRARKGNS